MDFFLCVLGMAMVIEGTPYFAFPHKMKQWMILLLETSDGALRKMGLGLMVAGLLLIYLGRG